MLTSCPYCETLFNVDEALIRSLDARVRCGMCHSLFNARDNLRIEPAPAPQREMALDIEEEDPLDKFVDHEPESPAFTFQDDDDEIGEEIIISSAPDEDVFLAQPHSDPLDDMPYTPGLLTSAGDNAVNLVPEASTDDELDEDTFALLNQKPVKAKGSGVWLWGLGALVLLLAAGAQWGYANRDQLMASAEMRPLAEKLCASVGCELEPLRDLEQIALLRRSIYSHPNIDDALIISLAMVNNAGFAQDFPILGIRMADIRGQIVAERSFKPVDYFGIAGTSPMLPGVPVTVTLEIHDPGNDAMAFELEFL